MTEKWAIYKFFAYTKAKIRSLTEPVLLSFFSLSSFACAATSSASGPFSSSVVNYASSEYKKFGAYL